VDRHELEGDVSCTLWLASGASPGQLLEPPPGTVATGCGLCQWGIGGARAEAAKAPVPSHRFSFFFEETTPTDFDLHQG
jgi:hypothetical protein